MKEDEIKTLQEELEEFQREREAIKSIIGSIGGKISGKKDKYQFYYFDCSSLYSGYYAAYFRNQSSLTCFIFNRDRLVISFGKNYMDDT